MQRALVEQIAGRFQQACGAREDFDVFAGDGFCPTWVDRPWVTMTSSRLGHDTNLHRQICAMVNQSLIDCRRRDAICVIAVGSAIEPWAVRATELFQVPLLGIVLGVDTLPAPNTITDSIPTLRINADLPRDETAILIGDRVDAVYVRRGGLIAKALQRRLENRGDATTRVAIIGGTSNLAKKCAGKRLISMGAVGWLHRQDSEQSDRFQQVSANEANIKHSISNSSNGDWIHSEGEWLVHCTRSCLGPWPGQTDKQYRDAMLLGDAEPNRTPLQTLRRIIRNEKLIAGAIASAKKWPVVCFSEAALADLILSRCYRPHLKRWDYEPYGIAIRRTVAERLGCMPVIYGDQQERSHIDLTDQYRFQAKGKTYDWTAEREWRYNTDVDLQKLDKKDVRVFVGTNQDAIEIENACPWEITAVLEPARNDSDGV